MLLALMGLVGSLVIYDAAPASAAPSLNSDQCANGEPINPANCTDADPDEWGNGNLNSNNSTYAEGDTVPFRGMFSGLTIGSSYFIDIVYDTTKGGKHAFDYLTTFNSTVSAANPCAGLAVTVCDESTWDSEPIPIDPQNTGAGVTQEPGEFRLFGGIITSVFSPEPVVNPYTYPNGPGFAADKTASIRVHFTASTETPVFAWGGHIATRFDWADLGGSAANIKGSAYHMSTGGSGGTGGEHSMSADAVILPSSLTIVKDAAPNSAQPFAFVGTGSAVLPNFSLTDNGGTSSETTFNFVTNADFNTKTVTEGANPAGWALTNIGCVLDPDSEGTSGASTSLALRRATVAVGEGQDYTCTFTNTLQNGTLTVIKSVAPPATAGQFTMHVTNAQTNVEVAQFQGSATGNQPPLSLPAGNYVVSETGGPAGYTASFSPSCPGGAITVSAGQAASCTVTNTAGTLSLAVTKTATPDTIAEPGGTVPFTVQVQNTSAEPVTLTSISDNVYGTLAGDPVTCHGSPSGTTLAPNTSCSFTFNGAVNGNAGATHTNTVTVNAVDDEGRPATGSGSETVTVTNVPPDVELTKTVVGPATRPEPGGLFTYNLSIQNNSVETVTITDLSDTQTLSAQCLALENTTLGAGLSTSCQYTATHTDAGVYGNTASVTVDDLDPGSTTDTDTSSASVEVTNLAPTVDIEKTVSPGTLPEPGGVFTYTLTITNLSPESVTITDLQDSNGLSGDCPGLFDEDEPTTLAAANPNSTADTVTCTYTVTRTDAGTYGNTASVVVTDDEGSTGTDSDAQSV
ncbi:MAG TPA: hypothetical protein VJ804_13720, partial [Acidimicrobiales bacterium]|nr:hypothetical protein [Acidimicrobiales bacterium]